MKVQIISDVHTEMHADRGASFSSQLNVTDVDVLVLAGDIGTTSTIANVIRRLARRVPHVVYVPGNHEFYDTTFEQFYDHINDVIQSLDNVHVLDGEAVTIEGQRFVGGTLWFPVTPTVDVNRWRINDFSCIGDSVRIGEINERHVKFMTDTVTSNDIVVTHHLPHRNSISRAFANSTLNCFFLCDMTGVIMMNRPKLWLHGHTHTPCDYILDETRIVCNPHGYPSEIHGDRDIYMTVDV